MQTGEWQIPDELEREKTRIGDVDTGTFESAGFNADNQPSGIDFLIVPGEGYFIYMKQEVVDFNY